VSATFPLPGRTALFEDRADAGRRLAERLHDLRTSNPVVVALPRGGVPVAHEVASALGAPLDVLAVRKLGAPQNPEYGVGAVAEDGTGVIDLQAAGAMGVSSGAMDRIVEREAAELRRRVALYRDGRPPIPLEGRTVIVVDDGVATGLTDLAAVRAVRKHHPQRLIVALPVCAEEACRRLAEEADDVVCLHTPKPFSGVGQWYGDFSQVSDEEVMRLLAADHSSKPGAEAREAVTIPAGPVALAGDLVVPADASGLVLFAHGSGSSRRSPRNVEVASELNRAGLGTLLFDLLSEAESRDRANVFDIGLLSHRLVAATRWARSRPDLARLSVGYFGASTGAAAALRAAAELPQEVAAVVSRGGRPDLAGDRLSAVRAPTLLIVGSRDPEVLALNRAARQRLGGPSELMVVEGAGHLFEEPGELTAVSRLAADWFRSHLAGPPAPGG
jgi:putative phosphoribosyl transferase